MPRSTKVADNVGSTMGSILQQKPGLRHRRAVSRSGHWGSEGNRWALLLRAAPGVVPAHHGGRPLGDTASRADPRGIGVRLLYLFRHGHPGLPEAVKEAAMGTVGLAIHN